MANYLTSMSMFFLVIMIGAFALGLTTDMPNWGGFAGFLADITEPNSDIFQALINSWFESEVIIGGVVTTALAWTLSGGTLGPYLIRTFMLASLITWFLYPFGLISSFGLPDIFNMFIVGLFSVMLGLATMGFVSGSEV